MRDEFIAAHDMVKRAQFLAIEPEGLWPKDEFINADYEIVIYQTSKHRLQHIRKKDEAKTLCNRRVSGTASNYDLFSQGMYMCRKCEAAYRGIRTNAT